MPVRERTLGDLGTYPSPMLYRVVRSIHRRYALTVFWLYVALFGVAFCFVFMFPPATIALLFVGIFGLVAVTAVEFVLAVTEHSLARRHLARATCPRCRGALHARATAPSPAPNADAAPGRVTCAQCGAAFEGDGSEIDPDDRAEAQDGAALAVAPPV